MDTSTFEPNEAAGSPMQMSREIPLDVMGSEEGSPRGRFRDNGDHGRGEEGTTRYPEAPDSDWKMPERKQPMMSTLFKSRFAQKISDHTAYSQAFASREPA